MLKNKTINARTFYIITFLLLLGLAYIFLLSPKSFLHIRQKISILNEKQTELKVLKNDMIQISNNIERLQTDKEYILSYAKTFGYLDKTHNEKIIKIIDNEENNKKKIIMNVNKKQTERKIISQAKEKINILGTAIVSLMIFVSIIFYILIIKKSNYKKV